MNSYAICPPSPSTIVQHIQACCWVSGLTHSHSASPQCTGAGQATDVAINIYVESMSTFRADTMVGESGSLGTNHVAGLPCRHLLPTTLAGHATGAPARHRADIDPRHCLCMFTFSNYAHSSPVGHEHAVAAEYLFRQCSSLSISRYYRAQFSHVDPTRRGCRV